jgi:aminodeoxyfutalosine deaminase
MSYRKLKADYLFDGYKMLRGEDVLICRQDGTIETVINEYEAGGDLEIFSGMLTPGFINCHCHLELSHLKGLIPEKQGLVNFVVSVVSQRNQPEEIRVEAARSAETSMLANGIVAVGDICNTRDTLTIKSEKRLVYYQFIEVFGWAPDQAIARFNTGKKLAALFHESGLEENCISLNPHAPYSISNELWNLMQPVFHGKTITIHNQETQAENEFFISGSGELVDMYARMNIDNRHFKAPGTRSLPAYLHKLNYASNRLLVHNTFTIEADIEEAQQSGGNLFFCLCPNANLYIENRLPDIPVFLKHKSQLVLGTDSLASNQQLSILEEMKTIKTKFPHIPTTEILLWASSNGARALSFDSSLGDFSKGKKPGIVLIENTEGGEIGVLSTCRRIL